MSILSNRYGVARPRQVTALLQRLQTALPLAPVLESAPVADFSLSATEAPSLDRAVFWDAQNALESAPQVETQTLAPWVQLYPHQRDQHLKAQRRFYAAIKAADLPLTMSVRLAGINALLGTGFTSSTQLSPDQLHAVADAIESNRFESNWTLDGDLIDEAPPESEPLTDTGTTPAAPEFLDEIALEYDLAMMRAANRARALNALRSERVLLETRLREVDHAILCA